MFVSIDPYIPTNPIPSQWLDYPERSDWKEVPFDNIMEGGLETLREYHQFPDAPRDYRLTDT